MSEPPPEPGHVSDDSSPQPRPTTGAPRWVKVFGIVVIALIVLFAIMQLTGLGGSHGPGRHMSVGILGNPVPSTGIAAIGDDHAGHRTPLSGGGTG